jgi:cerevisin
MVSHHPHGSINNSYIVVLKPGAAHQLANHMNFLEMTLSMNPLQGQASAVKHVYKGPIHGYAGYFSEATIDQIRQRPEVDYVEPDQIVRTMETQRSAPWGLARISHRPKLSFTTFNKYEFDLNGGEGVDAYVIDTGINIKHVEFDGRASWGATIPENDVDDDGNGHGSHCAGTIASNRYGVAKRANVIAVKVLGSNGSGSMSDVVTGVVWAANQASSKALAALEEFRATGKTSHKGSVANMSLGGGKSRALDDAVNRAVENGLHFAVAAGNDNKDACNYSPAAAEKAISVGASTLSDDRAYFSNFGECVDVFAPGLNILSTYKGSPYATAQLSGTSMASPHVAGLLAYLLSIYPSTTFNPTIDEIFSEMVPNQRPFITSLFVAANAVFPKWAASFLPAVAEAIAPLPPKVLTPLQLKKAVLALSTPGLLSDMPPKTPNLLVFNNATLF